MRELIERIAELIKKESGYSEFLQRPFPFHGKTIVTNAAMLIVFDGDYGFDPMTVPKSMSDVSSLTLTDFSLIPPTIEKPSGCNDRWEIEGPDEVECELCHGHGEVECEYGHDHDCPDCDGSGMVDNTEPTWHERKDERIDIGGHDYAAFYVWILNQLPNVRCAVHAEETKPLEFAFDGGHGKLCSIMKE